VTCYQLSPSIKSLKQREFGVSPGRANCRRMILNFTYKNALPNSRNINSVSRIKTKKLAYGNSHCLFRESEPIHKHNARAKNRVAYLFWRLVLVGRVRRG
jgi:hypothetical protein